MQVQTNNPTKISRGHEPARRNRRKLHLPLALANKPLGHPLVERAHSLSGHELRLIVAGMLG
ncbi:MAG: hypothetical protein H0W74_04260 [Sphingosinicella sp.]|nr:hypothetical protein [Sphingosinicella sp.]